MTAEPERAYIFSVSSNPTHTWSLPPPIASTSTTVIVSVAVDASQSSQETVNPLSGVTDLLFVNVYVPEGERAGLNVYDGAPV